MIFHVLTRVPNIESMDDRKRNKDPITSRLPTHTILSQIHIGSEYVGASPVLWTFSK
jgi:hypothetical protein